MGDEKKNVDISELEKLQTWVDNTETILADHQAKIEAKDEEIAKREEKINELEKEIQDLGDLVVTNKTTDKENDLRNIDIEIGKWWCAYRKRLGLGNDKARAYLRRLDMNKLRPNPKYLVTEQSIITKE